MLARLAVTLAALATLMASAAQGLAASLEAGQYTALLTDLQSSPAMVAPPSVRNATLSWALGTSKPAAAATGAFLVQTSYEVEAFRGDGSTFWGSGIVPGAAQSCTLPAPDCPSGCQVRWRVRVAVNGTTWPWSPNQTMFTPPVAFGQVEAIWAPANATGAGPQFALFQATAPTVDDVSAATLYITAQGPADDTTEQGQQKLLGNYKLWVGDALLGMGPGRSVCDITNARSAPSLCPEGPSQAFDGYDILAALQASGTKLFVECYGYDMAKYNISRRMAAELVYEYSNGTVATVLSTAIPAAWQSYDADRLYLAKLWEAGGGGHSTSQVSSSGGGSWYYAPHE